MSTRRRRPVRAALVTTLVGLAAVTSPFGPVAGASAPDTSVPGTAVDGQAPTGDGTDATQDAAPPGQVELVQSWSLTTGGTDDGTIAGSRPNFTYQVQPGAVIEDTVVLYNLGNVAMQFRVYATDAFNNADGQFDLLPGDEVPVDAGSWVQLVQETIILQPGKQATIPFTLTVPADAAPGDHVGAIVAGSVTPEDTGSGQAIDVERRTGTRLYVQVAGELTPELAVPSVSMSYGHAANPFGGTAEVAFTVENRGNVRISGTPVISVGGPFGLMGQEITLDPITDLLPGQRVELLANLEGVPALFLDTAKVRIDVDDASEQGGATDATASSNAFAPPITLLLILALVLLVLLFRRSYRRRQLAALPIAPTLRSVPAADDRSVREPQHQ